MDTKWLIAIVIGNVIAAIIKELVSGVIKRIPKMTATLKAKLLAKVIHILHMNWSKGLIIVDVIMWLFSGLSVLWLVYFSKSPLTKESVMGIGMSCGAWFYWLHQINRDFERYLAWKYAA
jgi:hypothetical protein